MFIVGHFDGVRRREIFPLESANGENPIRIKQIGRLKNKKIDNPTSYRVYDNDGLSPTLNTAQGGGRVPVIVDKNGRMRRLTPREAWRLQGFPEEYIDKVERLGFSDSRLYKMAGNAVSVPVANAIGKKLMEVSYD